jgi:hypothetical protein
MTYSVTHILNLALAVSLSTAAAGAQTLSNQSDAATTPTNVARVYVQTAGGVNVYTTSSTGKLTLVPGSPFKNTVGLPIGIARNHLITVGTHYVHSYEIESGGVIGAPVSQINTALFAGSECGSPSARYGGTIDRTGTEAYIQMEGTDTCAGVQTINVAASTGALTFGGVAYTGGGTQPPTFESPLVVAGNNGHAYALAQYYCENEFGPRLYRDRFGAMNEDDSSSIQRPPDAGAWFPISIASDNQNLPASHMAIALHADLGGGCGVDSTPPALAPYTVDYLGNLLYDGAMLQTAINPASMAINPQGNLLAAGGPGPYPFYPQVGPGLQVFHFNGANPITAFSNILTTAPIDKVAWDKSYHLYALSRATNKMYVFTITPTSITPVAGSPFTLNGPSAIVVRPL